MITPHRVLRSLLPKRIWQQIFLILVFLVMIPLVVLGSLLIHTSQRATKDTVLKNHRQIALRATGEIREHIIGARQTLSVTASILGRLHADVWRQETAIVDLALRNSAFERIASVDPTGHELASSELGTPLRKRSDEEAFKQALQGNSYLSPVKISTNHVPLITLGEPIRQMGQVKAALIADLNLRGVWAIIDDIRIGEQGIAYIIDQEGRVIAHPDKKIVMNNTVVNQSEILKDTLSRKPGNVEEFLHNERWLTSYSPIETLNWSLVISLPERQAYASLAIMKTQSWILIALSVMATIFISLLLSRYMSKPMKHMLEGTQRIAKGDYSYAFPIRGRGEIDKLLFSFNRIAKKMRKSQELAKLSIIGRAATAIAHELKNSLQLVETFVGLLPERHNDPEFIEDFSQTIPKELDSWNASLKNILLFSKNAYSDFPTQPLDVNSLVEEVARLTQSRARLLGILFNYRLDSALTPIQGNEERLKQVLLNMLGNALEATTEGGIIGITTRLQANPVKQSQKIAQITIMNTGEPIENVDKIFKPFFSTKSNGMGLGLSISKEIIESHSGQLRVTTDNQSTSFILELPLLELSTAPDSATRPALSSFHDQSV